MFLLNKPLPSKPNLQKLYNEQKTDLEETLKNLAEIISRNSSDNKMNNTIKFRVKSFSSLYDKILRIASETESSKIQITDILALRIICPFLEDVDKVSKMVQNIFIVEEVEVKGADYPYHRFGYESVHFLIRIPEKYKYGKIRGNKNACICEVQVRTILQDAWAEVEHEIIYKSDFSPLDEPLKRKLAALNANLTLSDITFQEIRDYQKELHKALKLRRKNFHNKIINESKVSEDMQKNEIKNYAGFETLDSLLLKGLTAHNEEKYNEAVKIYTVILEKDIKNNIRTIIHVHRGMAFYSSGQIKKAMEDFDKALELEPDNTAARYYRAVHFRINKRFEDALKDLEKCIVKEPFNLDYLTARGETYYEAGDLERAVAELNYVLSLDNDFRPAAELLEKLNRLI